MELSDHFKPIPAIRPYLNLGCLLDIPTGRYHIGKNGEHILNGGLSFFTGIGGRGNMFKSVVAHFMVLRALARYWCSHANFYDTEMSLTLERLYQLALTMSEIADIDLVEAGRLLLSDSTVISANDWFAAFRKYCKDKVAGGKSNVRTLPFIDKQGKNITCLKPSLFELDSFSMFIPDVADDIYDKNEIGDAKATTVDLRSAGAKNQMMMQLPNLTGSAHSYLVTTAHVGDKHELSQYDSAPKKLTFLKGKSVFKNVPEKFTFLTNNLWYCLGIELLQNDTTKGPEYPANPEDDLKGDTDLQCLTIQNLRAKAGPTGMPFQLVISQREGVLVGLTEFNYIKTFKYGMGGHAQSYYLELVPDVAMRRTTVRSKIKESVKIQRALEITSEMCQMENLGFPQALGYTCSPKELYDDLKAKGYDWDTLLNTRGYWVFEEDKHPQPFLSTLDLLKMRKGEYHPYWMPKVKAPATTGVTAALG